ncbi:MAG TPA: hypothetical protein VK850_00840 [Candidatus Binatia bacterium]|nr:hypothetical protein [Candidatus Binatia bacterium]
MRAASSGNITFIPRLVIASIAGALTITGLGLVAAPDLRAETPADQIKAAGAIPLPSKLLDKMEKFLKDLGTDDAAKAEFVAVAKESASSPEIWSSAISAKCPKAVGVFKACGLTPDEFTRGFFAITAVDMIDELTKSENKTVKANADFIAANKDRADTIFGAFLMLAEPGPAPDSTTP